MTTHARLALLAAAVAFTWALILVPLLTRVTS